MGLLDLKKQIAYEMRLIQSKPGLYMRIQIHKLIELGETEKLMTLSQFKKHLKEYADENKKPSIEDL